MKLPSDVQIFIEQTFPPEQHAEALSVLGQARIVGSPVSEAWLLRCAAVASRGSLPQLKHFTSLLAIDWRDVAVAGEYELRDKIPVRVRDLSLPLQV